MNLSKTRVRGAVVAAGLLLLTACSSGTKPATSGTDAVRTVEVSALDTLRFDPASVAVRSGESVRFVVTNAGKADHEFILGDEPVQMAHEEAMSEGNHNQMDAMASLSLKPGETTETTVVFDRPGEVMFGCHVPGHYKAGMVGVVTVA